ncbi:uncharacterized protein LOC114517049 [Dendronephthya gigantea]|uniref:uncharacterized protein LOC114517049 n=1 Tax=Dendronephthya gigantea TaxID=151771 RepID=UPI00106D1657|nr:uncharacterized protein LOC114517049 [Dendronephthya gigantea]
MTQQGDYDQFQKRLKTCVSMYIDTVYSETLYITLYTQVRTKSVKGMVKSWSQMVKQLFEKLDSIQHTLNNILKKSSTQSAPLSWDHTFTPPNKKKRNWMTRTVWSSTKYLRNPQAVKKQDHACIVTCQLYSSMQDLNSPIQV